MCKVRYAKGPLHCTMVRTCPITMKKPSYNNSSPREEGQFARVVTMNNNFMTRSGRKVGAPKKLIYD